MDLRIKKALAEKIGLAKLKRFGVSSESWGWKEAASLDLARLSKKALGELEAVLGEHRSTHGVGVLLGDIGRWRSALNDVGAVKARTVRQFEVLLSLYLLKVPGHRIYRREGEIWLGYYVNEIEYHEREVRHGDSHPEYVSMRIIWEEFQGKDKDGVVFYEADCRAMSVVEALARKGFYAETPDLRAAYLDEMKRFNEIVPQIGKQFLATGTGTDDLDGNPKGRSNSWYWSRTNTVQLENDGQPTRVVVDVFYEDPKSDRNEGEAHINTWFWENKAVKPSKGEEDEDKIDNDTEEEPPVIEIPVHPFVAVFDMSKHLRLRVHVNYLTEYKYDATLADKLVLAPELKSLVKLLIEHKSGGFRDIVKGKSGGAVVLLAGPPGTGKTLTAEVYAESEKRALYSVQCSQLGIEAEELEDELLKVFARAGRWNAVLLLDEADVYVHERGSDLQQNAIVGVFLRVLEYQDSVLFLTTNRPDDVDDAIASRCVARLNYPIPSRDEQTRIWRVLANGTNARIDDRTISEVVERNPKLSGRDVKNLLKLAMLVCGSEPITAKTIEFVKQFKPTAAN